MDNIRVYEENGAIVIRGAEGKRATVSDMSGIVLHNDVCSDVSVISVNKGVYVVKVNGKAIKVTEHSVTAPFLLCYIGARKSEKFTLP